MLALKKLLVVIEPEQDTQPALDKALRLARLAKAELELVICDYSTYLEDGYYFDPPQAAKLRAEHVEKNRVLLEEMAQLIRRQGFRVSVDALWGKPPADKLIAKVLESAPDMVLQSTRKHEKIARLLLSHQDWQLLRYCPCPVLLVKDKSWSAHPVIVVSVDPTHAHDKPAALDYSLTEFGVTLAQLVQGSVHLFHSCYQPPVSGIYPIKQEESVYHQITADMLEKYAIPDTNLHISGEEIQRSLPVLTKELDANVVVMGAVSRSRLDRFFVGSTAEKLLDALEQDVLVVKPEGFTDKVKKARPENP